jgi:hypothetical protein
MAVWQYDILVVPRSRVKPLTPALRAIASDARGDEQDFDWWLGANLPFNYSEELRSILQQRSEIAEGWELFGEEQGTRVDVLHEGARVALVRLRLDARFLDPRELVGNSELIEPDPIRVWIELELSSAVGFVVDPEKFLANLRDAEKRGKPSA